MLYIGITFDSAEKNWLKWYKTLTMTMLTTQSLTDLLNNKNRSGFTYIDANRKHWYPDK